MMVEGLCDVARQLDVLALILTHGNAVRLIEQDVGGHEHRVGQQANAGALFRLGRFLLELRHAVGPAHGRDAVEQPGKLGVLLHV